MDVTGQEYQQMSKKTAPKSPILKDCIWAFLVGGLLCAAGQAVADLMMRTGLEIKDARLLGSMSLIALSIVLTGLNIYDNIAKHAGAGTLVPITGFANAMVSPALEFKSEGLILGTGAKMFAIAGPVLVYGISASVLYGLIRFLFGQA